MPSPRPWTDDELATLAELAETFVRGDALRRARLTIEALERAADPSQVDQFRLVLRLIQSPIANLLLAGTPRPFRRCRRPRGSATSCPGRHRGSRSAGRRSRDSASCLRSSPMRIRGPSRANPRLAAIGYRPDDPDGRVGARRRSGPFGRRSRMARRTSRWSSKRTRSSSGPVRAAASSPPSSPRPAGPSSSSRRGRSSTRRRCRPTSWTRSAGCT